MGGILYFQMRNPAFCIYAVTNNARYSALYTLPCRASFAMTLNVCRDVHYG